MKLLKKWINADTVFTWMRAFALAAGAAGTLIALYLGFVGVSVLGMGVQLGEGQTITAAAAGLAAVIITSVCCYAALAEAYTMCGRLETGSAFTERNAGALERIARVFVISGVSIAAATLVLIVCGRDFNVAAYVLLLFVCLFFGLALIAYALCLLVRRAAALQQENDLTI